MGSTGGLTLAGTGTGGVLNITPTAGQNLNVNLSGAGDLAVNTNQLYVDTSAGRVGIGTTTPSYLLHISRADDGDVAGFTDSNGTCSINPTSTALICSSDFNLKKDITAIENPLDAILALREVKFKWKNQDNDTERVGFIAQEVEQVLPNLVITNSETGLKAISLTNFIPYLVGAVKELNNKIETIIGTGHSAISSSYSAVVTKISKLTVGSKEEPSGITLYDRVTKEPYCSYIENGYWKQQKGNCEDVLIELNFKENNTNNEQENTETQVEQITEEPVIEEESIIEETIEEPVIEELVIEPVIIENASTTEQ